MGRILFYVLWPLVWFYAPLTVRVRAKIRCGSELLYVVNWFGAGGLQLPGGGMKRGESAIETVIREVEEELGVLLTEAEVTQATNEPLTIRRWGLLMREHIVDFKLESKPSLRLSHEITRACWVEEPNS